MTRIIRDISRRSKWRYWAEAAVETVVWVVGFVVVVVLLLSTVWVVESRVERLFGAVLIIRADEVVSTLE